MSISVSVSSSRSPSPTPSDSSFPRAASIEAVSNSTSSLETGSYFTCASRSDRSSLFTDAADNPSSLEVDVLVVRNGGETGESEEPGVKGNDEIDGLVVSAADAKNGKMEVLVLKDGENINPTATKDPHKNKNKGTDGPSALLCCCCKPKKVTKPKKAKPSTSNSCCSMANARKYRKRFIKILSGPMIGFVAGVGGMWLFMKSGGSGAAAIAGMVGVSVSSNARGTIAGDHNIVVGQGQNGLININTAIVGGGATENDLTRLILECLQIGMIYVNTASGALYAWSPINPTAICLEGIPDSMKKGECSADPEVAKKYKPFGKYSSNPARNRRDLDVLRHITPAPDDINDDWPIQHHDYVLFNTALAVCGVALGVGLHRLFINPVIKALATYRRRQAHHRDNME